MRLFVISHTATPNAPSHGGSGSRGGDRLAKFVSQERLKPLPSNTLLDRTVSPIMFRTPTGQVAYGYEATARSVTVWIPAWSW